MWMKSTHYGTLSKNHTKRLGHREKKHKEWISQEAWQKIKERRNIKQKLQGIKSERLKEQQKQYPAPVKVEEDPLPYTDQFTYLGSTVRHDRGAGSDIINRIGKARNAFRMLSPLWKSQQYKTYIKLKLYKSCVLSTLLYGSECWRMTEKHISKLSSFHTNNLRKIVRIFWPQIISYQDLFDECQQESIESTIAHRRWRWIGHMLPKDQGSIPRVEVE